MPPHADVLQWEHLPFPKSLRDFQKLFPDDAACARYLEGAKWPKGFVGAKSLNAFVQQAVEPGAMEEAPGRYTTRRGRLRTIGDPDAFARSDGFDDIDAMARFWRDVHGVSSWEGLLIGWAVLAPEMAPA